MPMPGRDQRSRSRCSWRLPLGILGFASMLLQFVSAGATVIFDSFAPGGGFHPQENSGAAFSMLDDPFPPTGIRAAARFTVTGGSSQLTSITLPISVQRNTGMNILRVRLAADNGGVPGTTLEVLSENQDIWPTLTNPFTTTTTLNSVTHPMLLNGSSYWIVT